MPQMHKSAIVRGRGAATGLAVAAALMLAAACSGSSAEKMLASGQARLDRGDTAGALVEARALLDKQPESGPGRLLLARTLLAQGDLRGAESELQRAERFGVPAADLAVPQARLWLAQGQAERVIERHANATTPELLTLVATAHAERKNAAAAKTALALALAESPSHLPALALHARLRADGGDLAGATRDAETLTRMQPQAAQAWHLLGELLARVDGQEGKEAAAIAAFRQALQLEPARGEAHAALVTLLLRTRDLAAAKAQVAELRRAVPGLPLTEYLDGLTAFLGGDLARAQERTQLLLKLAEPSPQVLLLAGMTEARLGAHSQAETHLAAAATGLPGAVVPRRELAALLLLRGRPDRALAALQPLLEERGAAASEPERAELWVLAGQAHARRADFAAAEAAFARARQLRPADAALRTAAAKVQLSQGRHDIGLAELQAVARADTGQVGADLALITALMQRGDRAAALKAITQAAVKQPRLPLLPYLRGRIVEEVPPADAMRAAARAPAERIAQRTAARAQARAAYEEALALDGRFRPAVDALAALDMAEQQPDAARRRYEAYLKLEPQSAPAMLAMAELALRRGEPVAQVTSWIDRSVRADPKDAVNWRAAVDLQRRLGDPVATLTRAQSATSTLPDEPDLLFALAEAQQMAGEATQAVTTLARLTQQRPQSGEAHLRLAIAHGLAGKTAAARGPLARALELEPESPGVLRASLRMALAERDPERARALARGVQQRRPREALGWQLEGELEAALGRMQPAAAAWRTAYERHSSPATAVDLHRALLAADPAGAAAFAQRRLAAAPEDALFLAHLAEVAMRAGRNAEAEAHYRQALRIEPDHVLVMNNLAGLLTRRGDPEGLVLAKRAAGLQPHLAAVLDTLAAAHAAAHQGDEALRVQSRAVELQPREPVLRIHLARYLLARGERSKAATELQRAIDGLPPSPQRQEAESMLQRIAG